LHTIPCATGRLSGVKALRLDAPQRISLIPVRFSMVVLQPSGLSYQYALSKRTQLNVSVAQLRNQHNGRYNFWIGGLGSMQLPASNAGSDPRLIYAGIKHVF
jgi:hypothetical protein